MSGRPIIRPARVRFYALDGMRGIAALAVVGYHTALGLNLPPSLTIHGNIAVDFFFCLSGFVLAFTHQDQLFQGKAEKLAFARSRFIRLWPTILAGTLLTLAATLIIGGRFSKLLPIDFLLSLILLPRPAAGNLLWFNGVYWSLLAEVVVNILWAVVGRHLTTKRLVFAIIAMTLALLTVAATMKTVHFFYESYGSIPLTTLRASVSFFLGVLMHRIYRSGRVTLHVHPAILIAVLAFPMIVPGGALWFRLPLYLIYIVILNPAVVLLGALSTLSETRVLKWLGDLSFPLYAVHSPIIDLIIPFGLTFSIPGKLAFSIAVLAIALLVAELVSRFFDKPVRAWLRSRTTAATRRI